MCGFSWKLRFSPVIVRKLIIVSWIVLAVIVSSCVPAGTGTTQIALTPVPLEEQLEPGDYHQSILINDVHRSYNLHIPSNYQPGVPVPLVINLHGRGGTAFGQDRLSFMTDKAEQEGFIVLTPQARGSPATWWPAPGPNGQEDLEFFRELIAQIENQLSIDPARIFVTGFSNGGAMANWLACNLSEKIAAIAPVAGAHPQMNTCEPRYPVAVIIFHGQEDRTVPYLGDGDYLPPVPAWSAAWAYRNSCDPNPAMDTPLQTATRQTWSECSNNSTVMLYTIEGGRHDWPGSGFGPGPYPEDLAPDVYATDLIWDFFIAHPKD
jgi:polyhydroxybutyrate depolymerase